MLQELFRLLTLEQTPPDVQIVKDCLGALNPNHPVQRYRRQAGDLTTDAGLVDAFLHRRDKSYDVAACLELVSQAGLTFQGWNENSLYYPDGQVPATHPLYAAISKLEPPALWQAMELFYGCLPVHFFHVCRRDRPEAHYRVNFDGDAFFDYVPRPRITQRRQPDSQQPHLLTIARPPFLAIALNAKQSALFAQVDGQRTVRTCLLDAGLDCQAPSTLAFARAFFRSLWRVGYMVFGMQPPGGSTA
jgi:hypothetical protein